MFGQLPGLRDLLRLLLATVRAGRTECHGNGRVLCESLRKLRQGL